MKVIEYFTDKELACRCGCGLLPPSDSVERLYALRLIYGRPLVITSGARCHAYNVKVGGAAGSTHMPAGKRAGEAGKWGGCGFDISTPNLQKAGELERIALSCGFRGIGRGGTFLHIDDANRPQITFWKY